VAWSRKVVSGLLILLLLAACENKNDRAQSVYATAYRILTQTAAAAALLPTQTPIPVQQTDTLPLVTITLTPPATLPPPVEPTQLPPPTAVQANPTVILQAPPPPTLQLVQPTQKFAPTLTNPPATPTHTQTPTAILVGPTSTPTIPAPDQGVLGFWQQDHTGRVIQFDAQGVYRSSESYVDLADGRFDLGSYVLQNDLLTMTGSTSSAVCRGQAGIYKVTIPVKGQRNLTYQQDPCFDRQQMMARGGWYWLPVSPATQTTNADSKEAPVQVIPLFGPLSKPEARINGMTWVNDILVILPGDPAFTGASNQGLFAIPKGDLLGYISGVNTTGIYPFQIIFEDSGISTQLAGFRSYQALAYANGRLYFIVTADTANGQRSYLVSGAIQPDFSSITLDASKVVEIPGQSNANGFKSLVIVGNELVVLPQSNQQAGSAPTQRFDLSLNYIGALQFPGLEYLITDATGVDSNNSFWVINRYAPGDPQPLSNPDALAVRYGEGITHQLSDATERLVALAWTAANSTPELALVNRPPVQLELWMKAARNWQALAILPDRGWIIATSQSPETVLGYIPFE
jgi:hypothetical protein